MGSEVRGGLPVVVLVKEVRTHESEFNGRKTKSNSNCDGSTTKVFSSLIRDEENGQDKDVGDDEFREESLLDCQVRIEFCKSKLRSSSTLILFTLEQLWIVI